MNLAKEIECLANIQGAHSRKSVPKMKNLYYQCAQFYEQEQEAGQSWQIGARDVPQLHQPERNVLQDNLVPICASTCMSWHTVYTLFAVGKWASATVFPCGPWHSHDQEAARWVELQIKGAADYLSTGKYRPVLDIPVSPDISARMTAGIVINRYCISYYKCIQNAPYPLKCLLKWTGQ